MPDVSHETFTSSWNAVVRGRKALEEEDKDRYATDKPARACIVKMTEGLGHADSSCGQKLPSVHEAADCIESNPHSSPIAWANYRGNKRHLYTGEYRTWRPGKHHHVAKIAISVQAATTRSREECHTILSLTHSEQQVLPQRCSWTPISRAEGTPSPIFLRQGLSHTSAFSPAGAFSAGFSSAAPA